MKKILIVFALILNFYKPSAGGLTCAPGEHFNSNGLCVAGMVAPIPPVRPN